MLNWIWLQASALSKKGKRFCLQTQCWINRVQQSNKMSVYCDEQPQMWHRAAVADLIMVRLRGLMETSLCIQLTYTWLTFCCYEAGRLTLSVNMDNLQTCRSLSCQTDWWRKNLRDQARLAAGKERVADSAHPLLPFIWPVVSSWDDQHSKWSRDGKWALSQQDMLVSWFTPLFKRH